MRLPCVIIVTARRGLHSQPRPGTGRQLVGPPDPISHLRPVIYDDPSLSIQPKQLNHPYSLAEFSNQECSFEDLELLYKLQSQHLDAFNHQFWFDVCWINRQNYICLSSRQLQNNTRFEAAKAMILEALPEYATALDKEHALSNFYGQWMVQESERMDAYTVEWRKRNFALIALAARLEYRRLCKRVSGFFTTSTSHRLWLNV
jgi:hypothetical protein